MELVAAINAYSGIELVRIPCPNDDLLDSQLSQIGVTVGEAENPQKTIPIGEDTQKMCS